MDWKNHVSQLSSLLSSVSCQMNGEEIGVEDGFRCWKEMALKLKKSDGTIYLIGNGASASMASHMAADLAKNAHVHTEVFSDLSLITAISNDMGYENIFSEPLRRRARTGDMLIAISSSGSSENVLSAVQVAREKGLDIVTLSAMKDVNPLRSLGAINIYVAAQTYGYAESAHAVILHHWMDML